MKVRVKMPKFGLQMTDGVITDWKVSVGDPVKKEDVLFTVETDKLTNDVESPCDGRVSEILVESGDEVAVGAYCCVIEC